jgi:quercetin dioxygenase-like cupin family protein
MAARSKPQPNRRVFLCWCCTGLAAALTAGTVDSRPVRAAGFTRTILNKQDFPGSDYVTLQVQVDVDPGFLVARHTHPGVETSYLATGGGTLSVKGKADRQLAAGDSFQIPPEVPHALQNGAASTRVLVTYVVDKNKPLATPAPE